MTRKRYTARCMQRCFCGPYCRQAAARRPQLLALAFNPFANATGRQRDGDLRRISKYSSKTNGAHKSGISTAGTAGMTRAPPLATSSVLQSTNLANCRPVICNVVISVIVCSLHRRRSDKHGVRLCCRRTFDGQSGVIYGHSLSLDAVHSLRT
jgi:hypothetical protein